MFNIGGSIAGGGRKERRSSRSYTEPWRMGLSEGVGTYLTGKIGEGAEPYTGEFVAGMTPEQMESAGIARTTLQDLASVSPERVQKRWELFGRPAVREAYGGPGGYYSSERMTGEARAAEEYQLAEEERATQAAQALSGYETTGLGGLARRIEQEKLTTAFDEFIRTRPEYSPWLSIIMEYLGLPPTATYTKQTGKAFELSGQMQGGYGMGG